MDGGARHPKRAKDGSEMDNTRITPAALSALFAGDMDNFLVALMPGGIEAQEKRGQSALVNSAMLPVQAQWDQLAQIGIVRGDPVDDLFVNATLPAGWTKRATNGKATAANGLPWQTWGGKSDAVAWAETVGFEHFHAVGIWTKVQSEGKINSKDMPEPYYNACLERIAAGKTDAKAQEPTDAELDAQAAAEEKPKF